jgi:ribosomal protein S18 acetylase RimI-like enzyme
VIRYTSSLEGVTPDRLVGFFEGWPNHPTPDRHVEILRASDAVALAIDDETGRVVGFGTAVSDGILAAYIPLLEVLPEHRNRGIGGRLMRMLIESLDGIYMIDLVATAGRETFYERLGFVQARAMVRRDFSAQTGRDTDAGKEQGA